ncbi:hypothetical protein PL373_13380 [Tenacibaculum maritimum]|nr:hypothetical protein [Tenacibaculum maritimum]MDB0600283.1 hypothetical protein [Tenacibaculum maritimum]MDB0602121.1 hypothetical protein [Tenacibaculum maritimum]MDB0610793.1 hypothetical protein [Tenacibaculum maritimum]
MNNLFEKLNHTERMLAELDNEMEAVMTLPYYEIFGNKSERDRDVQMINRKKKLYLNKKYNLLENIQIASEKEKAIVSVSQRNLQLKKAS